MTHTAHVHHRFVTVAGLVAAAAFAPSLSAQSVQAGAHWQSWLGCWAPVVNEDTKGLAAAPAPPRVCITPAPASGDGAMAFTTIVNGAVADRTILNANAQHVTNDREGCKGWDSADWAKAGQRLYLHSEHVCDGGIERHATGILTMTGSEWIDVRRVATTGTTGVIRALHYRPATDMRGIPADLIAQIPTDRAMAVNAARLASEVALTTADVIDAVHNVDAPVVEAWLVERGQKFTLDDKQLRKMADARVPESVIDIVVAVSYPKQFALDHSDFQGERRTAATNQVALNPGYYGSYDPFRDFYGYGYNGYGYGYNQFGGYYYGSRPVTIYVRGDDGSVIVGGNGEGGTGTPANPSVAPKVVNGQGYTRGTTSGSSSGGSATTSSTSSGSSSSGSSSSGSSSGSSSSGSSSSGGGASSAGSSGGRTAIPRCTAPKCEL